MTGAVTAEAALGLVKSGHRVFVHGAAATPSALLRALVEHAPRLQNVELIHLHTEGELAYADEKFRGHFKVANLFVGENARRRLDYDRIDFIPCFLSEVPLLFRSKRRKIDVALLHLSPPDSDGLCSLGVSVDVALAAFECAEIVIAQINHQMPRVLGSGFVPLEALDAYVEVDEPLPELKRHEPTESETAIGRHVADLIPDGACLQIGVGSVPNAVLAALRSRRSLGVHSETWSDGVLDLIEAGAIDNSRKAVYAGASVSGFLHGSRRLYDFVRENPAVVQFGADVVNNPAVIARNKNAVAINSAVEVDLTGQICADSVGHRIISGIGGQMDFMRGAALSEGGRPIIAMTSRTRSGSSRLVAALHEGSGVVTTRGHAHFIVTEYGVADLFGRTLRERAFALIEIAHPDDREALARSWSEVHRQV